MVAKEWVHFIGRSRNGTWRGRFFLWSLRVNGGFFFSMWLRIFRRRIFRVHGLFSLGLACGVWH